MRMSVMMCWLSSGRIDLKLSLLIGPSMSLRLFWRSCEFAAVLKLSKKLLCFCTVFASIT